MKNYSDNKNIIVNRTLFYKNHEELVSIKKQILSKEINSLQTLFSKSENESSLVKTENSELHNNNNICWDNESESNKSSKKGDFINFLFYWKQIKYAVESLRKLAIQPSQLNIMLTSIFYFIAICSTLERRENNRYFSILLQGKIPGYATLYQNGCWESFENLTSKYLKSEGDCSTLLTKPSVLYQLPASIAKTSSLQPSKFDKTVVLQTTKSKEHLMKQAQSQDLTTYYINDINVSKDRALLSTRSPWNKEAQKDFRAFFIDSLSKKENITSKKSFSENISSPEKTYFIAPWYKIDASPLPSDIVVATRETPVKETESKDANVFDQQNKFCDNIKGLEYLIPYYRSKEQIFLENDSIPSKCNSLKLTEYTGLSNSLPYKSFLNTKPSYKYLSAFQRILNKYFYIDGLLLLNLAETASPRFVLPNISDTILPVADTKLLLAKASPLLQKLRFCKTKTSFLQESLVDLPTETSSIDQNASYPTRESKIDKENVIKSSAFVANPNPYSAKLGFKDLFSKSFRKNNWNSMRYVSGYKFPDLNSFSVHSLFKQVVIPRVLLSVSFSPTYLSLSPFTENINIGKASQLVNKVLLTPFRLNLPPALPTCYFKDLILLSHSLPVQKVKRVDSEHQGKNTEKFKILYKGITLPEFTQITKVFEKVGVDYQDYLKQPKDSPFAILISPSLEDDDAIKMEADRKTEQGEKKMTLFQLLQDIRQSEQQLEKAKDLRSFSAKNVLACHSFKDASNLPNSKISPVVMQSITTESKNELPLNFRESQSSNQIIDKNLNNQQASRWAWSNFRSPKFSEFFKSSFFGEMSLLPKLLAAQDQKEIKEQLLEPSNEFTKQLDQKLPVVNYKDRLPNLQLRAEKDVIDLLAPANLEVRNAVGSQHRTFKSDVFSSLKASAGDITKFCYSAGHKRKITSNLFVAPSQQHVTLPQISGKDWKKILEWQLKTYFFDEQKRLQSLSCKNEVFARSNLGLAKAKLLHKSSSQNRRKSEAFAADFTPVKPEKQFKMKKLTIYLPWVTFRTSVNNAFEWPLTRLDFREFVPNGLSHIPLQLPSTRQVDYMIAAKNMTLSLNDNSKGFLKTKVSKGEKLINKQYLFQGVTNQSYLLIYRLFLLFVLKSVFQYVYRISLRQFLIKMAYSDFGLTVTSPEFREWLQDSAPKSVYKVEKSLQSIAGIEHNISTISQIIWHLRNFGRTRQNIPAVLLLGPTSAEKTSLVQAIASEAKVNVVVQPLDALLSNSISPYEKLEETFLLARKQAPCILFLDSIDRIGKSRKNVVSNYAGAEDSLFCLDADIAEGKHDFANLTHSLQTRLLVNRADPSTSPFDRFSFNIRSGHSRGGGYADDALSDLSVLDQQDATQNKDIGSTSPFSFYQEKTEFESLRINLLLRLLTEIDGISPLQGVIVMASSDQSAILDPALLRPGRFQTMIKLSLPDKTTRIQLLKVESQKLGSSHSIPWEYLAKRTNNMSGADILSAVNHSAIRAILDNTVHTIQSLEHGLNCALGLPKNKNIPLFTSKTCNDPFHTSRLAFYQAGKVVVQNLLLEYPNDAFFSLESTLLNTEKRTSNITLDAIQEDFKLVSPSFGEVSKEGVGAPLSPPVTYGDGESDKGANTKTNQNVAFREQSSIVVQNRRLCKQSITTASKDPITESKDLLAKSSHSEGDTFFATTRIQFQTRLVALYAGKAAELLQITTTNASAKNIPYIDPFINDQNVLQTTKSKDALFDSTEQQNLKINLYNNNGKSSFHTKNWQSNLAFSDLLTASSVIHAMIDRWYLYSQKLFTLKSNQVFASLNYEQMQEQHDFVLFHKLTKQVYSERAKIGFWSNSKDQSQSGGGNEYGSINQIIGADEFSVNKQIRQERQRISWWNEKICQEVEMFERPYGKWYRLYLPKVEQRERNEEWVPPDLLFHDFSPLSNIGKDHSRYLKTLHDLYLFERDSAYYNVVMNCFYKAFNLLSENRELVDLLADHFIRFKILRSPEMSTICSLYLH